jgi:hypothetical protein
MLPTVSELRSRITFELFDQGTPLAGTAHDVAIVELPERFGVRRWIAKPLKSSEPCQSAAGLPRFQISSFFTDKFPDRPQALLGFDRLSQHRSESALKPAD